MTDENFNDQHSPRLPKNWEKFKTWAADMKFLPEEIADASSLQEAEKTITRLKEENENEKEYFENLDQLLQAVEQLYLNMCLIDDKMRTLTKRMSN